MGGSDNILIDFGALMELIRLTTMCSNDTRNKCRIGKYLSDAFATQNDLNQADVLSSVFFHLALEYAIRYVQANYKGLQWNETYEPLTYADDDNLFGKNIHAIKKTLNL
jgi:hypothetical protein